MNSYNPDVLNCIANLSNDEVFTPPALANQVLDLLPQELFQSTESRFLDPFTKSGVFLREIVKRLDKGLSDIIPDRQERIDHIMHKQVFGIACTELTALLARRSVYCSKTADGKYSVSRFDTPEGNIRYRAIEHTWVGGKCKFCGASQSVYDRGNESEQYAYQFIHTDNLSKLTGNMTFDVIIGNPPYQMSDGGNAASAKPLYHLFVQQAIKLKPRYLTMIIPARWYAGGKGLDEFRSQMLNDNRIKVLVDFKNSADCFAGVNIAGGVCYFVWSREEEGKCLVVNMKDGHRINEERRYLNEYPIFVRDNYSIRIIHKVQNCKKTYYSQLVHSRNSFNLPSNERGHNRKTPMDLQLLSSDGLSFINADLIYDKTHILNKYKVVITYAMSGGNKPTSEGNYQIISSLLVIEPRTVYTETYLTLSAFDSSEQAKNCLSYFKTKFVRFLMLQALSSIHITKSTFQFVPIQDFSHPWTDEMLYRKYNLTEEEIEFIESMIRPME